MNISDTHNCYYLYPHSIIIIIILTFRNIVIATMSSRPVFKYFDSLWDSISNWDLQFTYLASPSNFMRVHIILICHSKLSMANKLNKRIIPCYSINKNSYSQMELVIWLTVILVICLIPADWSCMVDHHALVVVAYINCGMVLIYSGFQLHWHNYSIP